MLKIQFLPLTEAAWNCYVCSFNGSHNIEGRLLFTLMLGKEPSGTDEESFKAQVLGNFGSFITGNTSWKLTPDDKLMIGEEETYVINDCTKDFLKLTSVTARTSYFFIAQKSRGFASF